MARKPSEEEVVRYADMFSAMGTEARLRILRLLLAAHPDGMTVGDIGTELGIPGSTLSHHLEKLKNEGRADQVAGKVQNVVGGLKDKVREHLDKDKDDDQRH